MFILSAYFVGLLRRLLSASGLHRRLLIVGAEVEVRCHDLGNFLDGFGGFKSRAIRPLHPVGSSSVLGDFECQRFELGRRELVRGVVEVHEGNRGGGSFFIFELGNGVGVLRLEDQAAHVHERTITAVCLETETARYVGILGFRVGVEGLFESDQRHLSGGFQIGRRGRNFDFFDSKAFENFVGQFLRKTNVGHRSTERPFAVVFLTFVLVFVLCHALLLMLPYCD